MQRRFVLLDRDGTLNVERHYLSDPDRLVLLPGVVEGLAQLQELGCGLVVVTNQSGVGRGLISARQLRGIHRRLHRLLEVAGVVLDGVFVCPHIPDSQCDCRKPLPGLATRAAREFGFRLDQSFVVGDKACDVELGRRVGATTILVRTGHGAESARVWTSPNQLPSVAPPDFIVDDFLAATRAIASRISTRHGRDLKPAA